MRGGKYSLQTRTLKASQLIGAPQDFFDSTLIIRVPRSVELAGPLVGLVSLLYCITDEPMGYFSRRY